ncbi:prepilin peptidase [Sorangium sp. So ce1128]
MLAIPHAMLVAAVAVAVVAAWTDLRTGQIPNWATLGPLAAAPLLHFLLASRATTASEAVQAAGFSLVGALVCAAVPIVLYRAGAIGGGDVKLLSALGAILGTRVGIEAELYAFVLAAVVAPARLAWEGRLLRVLGNTAALVINPFLPKARRRTLSPEMMTSIRFGPAILAGTLVTALLHWRHP